MSKEIESFEENEENKIDLIGTLSDVIQGIAKYWLILLVIISVSSTAAFAAQKLTYNEKYTASSTFIISSGYNDYYNAQYYDKAYASQIAKTFPYIIDNATLRGIVAEDLGLTSIPGTITAEAMSDTNMITISVTEKDPQLAYDILQSVIENYPQVANLIIGHTEMKVLNETGVPSSPSNPFSGKRAGAYGFIIGLIISAVLLLIYSFTRKTIQKEDDFKNILNVKCVGVIPQVRFKKRSHKEKTVVVLDNSLTGYAFREANRTLRTRIMKDAEEHHAKKYIVTSAVASEGKSTVAANLALSLAEKGMRVYLVDFDLRHPSVHSALGLPESNLGTIDILKGKVGIDAATQYYKDTNLMFIPGGKSINYATSTLDAKNIRSMLNELEEKADFIILDTPPSGMFTDAAKLVRYVDAGIFVVHQDYAPVSSITESIELLVDSGLRMAGCVLNGAESGIAGYGYGYGSSYGYGSKYDKYGKYGSSYGKYGGYGKYGEYKGSRREEGETSEDDTMITDSFVFTDKERGSSSLEESLASEVQKIRDSQE